MRTDHSVSIIIWGNDNYNVLGLLRQLTPYVEDVLFLVNQNKRHCATISKCCKKYIVVESIDEGIRFLMNYGSFENKTILLTTSDLLAAAVDQHKEELSNKYVLSSTDKPGLLTKAQNKLFQYELATRIGLNVPFSQKIGYDSICDFNIFPCLIKPAFKETGVRHLFKTRICHNEIELHQTQSLFDRKGTYVFQQYIKKEKEILIYGCRFVCGIVVYAGSFTKYRWSIGGDGSYGVIDSRIPSCIDVGKLSLFVQEIDYRGLFSAEFGVDNDKVWFYEFNLRNDGTSHYFFQAGIANLPLMWYQYHDMNMLENSINYDE